MVKFLEGLFWTSVPVLIAFAIDPLYGWCAIACLVFLLAVFTASAYSKTTNIYYTEILKVKEVYKRGHRYAGSSVGWFEGQPVAHFAYGKWHEGTKVLFQVHYRPGSNMRDHAVWATVGDPNHKIFMEYLVEDPSTLPPPQPVPKRPLWARLLRWLIAAPIAMFASALVIASVIMNDYSIIWFALVIMIPAIVIFVLTQRVK